MKESTGPMMRFYNSPEGPEAMPAPVEGKLTIMGQSDMGADGIVRGWTRRENADGTTTIEQYEFQTPVSVALADQLTSIVAAAKGSDGLRGQG